MPCILLAIALAVQVGVVIAAAKAVYFAEVAAVSGYGVMLISGVAALFILGARPLDKVGLRPFTSFQFLMLLFVAPSAAVLAAQIARLVSPLVPEGLRPPASDGFPYIALSLAGFCVLPALALELVFRGVVGRALIARLGVLVGSLLTCLALAATFVYPERIAEWFALAVVLQIVFAATRSLAATIVLSALCAAPAVLLRQYPDALSIPGYTHPEVSVLMPWPLLAVSGVVLAAALVGLHVTRTRYLTAAGSDWMPGYFSLERPPAEAHARLHSPDAAGLLVIALVTIFAGLVFTVFWENQRGIKAVAAHQLKVFEARQGRKADVPPIPTPQEVVDRMLELAGVKSDDVVYDLGCGDGRIVVTAAKKYGCRAVGIDIDPKQVAKSDENARQNRVGHLVEIKQDDIYLADLSQASVVMLYLLPEMNVRLIPQLERLKAGCRIVSHQWDMQGVKPDQTIVMKATDHESRTQDHTIYLWTTPLKRDDGQPLRVAAIRPGGRGPGFSPPDARRPKEGPERVQGSKLKVQGQYPEP